VLVKTDIFKGLMYYSVAEGNGRGKVLALSIEQVKNIQEMNARGEKPASLIELQFISEEEGEEHFDFEDVTGVVELPPEQKRKRRKNRKGKGRGSASRRKGGKNTPNQPASKTQAKKKETEDKPAQPPKQDEGKPTSRSSRRRRGRGRRPPKKK
jgi:hypothetical protein